MEDVDLDLVSANILNRKETLSFHCNFDCLIIILLESTIHV